MKHAVLIALWVLTLLNVGVAQLATDPNEGLWIKRDAPGIYTMRWYGRLGHTYFVQQSSDLLIWTYRTDIEAGLNLVIPYGFTASSDRFFVRLKHTDIPTNDPLNADFDHDGISNIDELSHGLDPFSNTDSDGDGLPDDWERFYFGNLLKDGTLDSDGDGFTDKEEFLLGLNPTVDDSVAASLPELSYDALGRLQTAGAVTYSYDAEGNIVTAGN